VKQYRSTGEEDCFSEIYDRHWARMFRIAMRTLRQRCLAEDAVQSTFERALRGIDGFSDRNEGASLGNWLARICKNVCLDELRKQRTRQDFDPSLAHMRSQNASTGNDGLMVREALEVLNDLQDHYRICYLLKVEGYSYEEIGAMTGYPFDDVKTFIRTARRNLEKKFAGKGSW